MKKKLTGKKIIALVIFMLTCISVLVYASQQIKIEVQQTPKVDIIMTKSKTSADVSNFEEELKRELVAQGVMSQSDIDAGKLNIQAVEARKVESQESFDWQGSSNQISSITFGENGKNVFMRGNPRLAGKNAIWILPDRNEEQEFNFDYSINFGDSFTAAGMLLRVQQNSNGSLEGYMLSFNNTGAFLTGTNGAFWHFIYDNNNNTPFARNSSIFLLQNLNINRSGTLNVKVTENDITISGGGLADPFTYSITSEPYGAGYGFFSDHYSHGCSNIGQFNLTNIDLGIKVTRKFTEVLQAPTWRDGSTKILVNVEDEENEQFSDPTELTSIISKLMNNNVYFIGWGTGTNQSQIQNVIGQNDNKGTYIANSSRDAVQATVDYLKTIIKPTVGNVIIADDPVNVKITSPISGVVTTPTKEFPNGVWKVEHNYNYYDNSQGQYEKDGMYTNNLIQEFKKVGKYTIYCEDKAVAEVFAHRRPVAAFNMNKSGTTLTLRSQSYDLDIEKTANYYNEQQANRGIKSEKWEYKKTTDSTWTEIPSSGIGQLITTSLDANTDYYIKLTVTDYQGEKISATKNITTGTNAIKPVAQFKVVNNNISKYENLQIVDESYDPAGSPLTYNWVVTKGNTVVHEGTNPLLDFSGEDIGAGHYKIQLSVSKTHEGEDITSDVFSQEIDVSEDATAPDIIITPGTKKTLNEDIDIDIEVKDEESGIKEFKYAFSTNTNMPLESEFTTVTVGSKNYKGQIKLPTNKWDEVLFLHVIATNNAGVASDDRIAGTYYIEPSYEFELRLKDEENGAKVKDAEFEIKGILADGSVATVAQNVKTDNNGKIKIEKAKLHNVKKLQITNTTAAPGYDQVALKNVGMRTDGYIITLNNSGTSEDVITATSNQDKKLEVEMKASRKTFDLKVTNKDTASGNLINGTEFVLKLGNKEVARGTTVNGEVILKAPIAGVKTNKDYTLVQENVNSVYTNIGSGKLNITFGENGEATVIKLPVFGANSSIEVPDTNKMEVNVYNSLGNTSSFSVNINVKDLTSSNPVVGSKYHISVRGEGGLNYLTSSGSSDANGNIMITGLYGTGTLELTLIHEEAAPGYGLETINKFITINMGNNGTPSYNQSLPASDGVYERIDSLNRILFVNLTNQQKASTNALKIRTLLKSNQNVGISGIGFTIKTIDGRTIGAGQTDASGLLEITGLTNNGDGTVLYKIIPDDYEKIQATLIFGIEYDKDKKIINVPATTVTDVNTYKTEDDDDDFYKYTANVDFLLPGSNIIGNNALTIVKRSDIDNSPIANAWYRIEINGMVDSKQTDNDGKIVMALPDSDTVTIKFKATSTPNGFKKDDNEKIVYLQRATNGVFYQTQNPEHIEFTKITISPDNGNVEILDECRSKENVGIKFNIKKITSDSSAIIGGVHFNVKEYSKSYTEEVITSSSGYVGVNNAFYVKVADVAENGLVNYEFELEETLTIEPYSLMTNPIKMDMSFELKNGAVKFIGENYIQGSEYLTINRNVNYDEAENEVTVNLEIKNYVKPSQDIAGRLYDLDIKKVDEDGNEITGSEYYVEVRPYATASQSGTYSIVPGAEVPNLVIKEDKTTILLKEVTPALGFYLDTDAKIVTIKIDENGDIAWDTDTSSHDKIEYKPIVNNATGITTLEVVITAQTTQGGSGTGGGTGEGPDTPVEPKPYDINIKKVDEQGNEITGAEYNVTVMPENKDTVPYENLTIDSNVEILNQEISNGRTVITLKETKAIIGYELDEEIKVVVLGLNEDGEITVISGTTNGEISTTITDDPSDASRKIVDIVINTYTIKKYSIDIKKVNSNGSEIIGAKYNVKISGDGSKDINFNGLTVNSGVEINNLSMKKGTTLIALQEKNAATGMLLDGTLRTAAIEMDSNLNITPNPLLTSDKVTVSITPNPVDTTKYIVKIEILTDPNGQAGITYPSGKKFDIDIINKDTEGREIVGAVYEIKTLKEGPTLTTKENVSIIQGAELVGTESIEGKYIITLKEKTPVPGCDPITELKTVTLKVDENGNISIEENNTSSDITVEIEVPEDGSNAKVKITITSTGNPTSGIVIIPPPEATLSFNIHNRREGDWDYNYIKRTRNNYVRFRNRNYYNAYPNNSWWHIWYTYTDRWSEYPEVKQYAGAQKLARLFNKDGKADSHGYNLISAQSITLEAREVIGGLTSSDIYETAEATKLETLTDTAGTHEIKLYKDYKNKTIEFTLIEKIPDANYKRNTNNARWVVEFDADGNAVSGRITQGVDLDEFAIPGISADGTVDNIIVTEEDNLTSIYKDLFQYYYSFGGGGYSLVERSFIRTNNSPVEYTYSVSDKSCIGKNTFNVALVNKEYHNELKITLNLKDQDTDWGLDGEVSVIIQDIDDNYNLLETKTGTVTGGTITFTLDNTYANRNLRLIMQQTQPATRGSAKYVNKTGDQIEVTIALDDDASIVNLNEITVPDYVKNNRASSNELIYTIYNEIIYNFAIDLKKVDENGNPLAGVRVKTETSIIDDFATSQLHEVHNNGSALTDENGNVRLKIVLPTSGPDSLYGRAFDIKMDEYYVPDNYKAETNMKVRVLFDSAGNIIGKELISMAGDTLLTIDDRTNKINPTDRYDNVINVTMQNELITDKPKFEITNFDVDDRTRLLQGTKYKISVFQEEDYTNNTLNVNEVAYTPETDVNGFTNVEFANAHALRTIIYQLQEVQTADSYYTNNDIFIKLVFDEEGKIVETPVVINPQKLTAALGNEVNVVTILGDPRGDTTLKMEIVSELEPKFTINITRKDTDGTDIKGKIFKVVLKEKDSSGNYSNILEERYSKPLTDGYFIGMKTDPTSKDLMYEIYEQSEGEGIFTLRGQAKVLFDSYGRINSADISGDYITASNWEPNAESIDITIEAEIFKFDITVEDTTVSGYDISGYKFNIENSKKDKSDETLETNIAGNVIEKVGEAYKGETITYTIKQVASPIDYDDIPDITLTVEFNADGTVKDVTPHNIPDVYDLLTTIKDTATGAQVKIKIYTKPVMRNKVEMHLYDEEDNSVELKNAQYNVEIESISDVLTITEANNELDIGSFKNYKGDTHILKIKQDPDYPIVKYDQDTLHESFYMPLEDTLEIAVTYDENGIIQNVADARIIVSDGKTEIDYDKTLGTGTLVLKSTNRIKVEFDVTVENKENPQDKIQSSTIKIVEKDKSDLFSGTGVTDANGKTYIYAGPHYDDKEVTYRITNPTQNSFYKNVPDGEFTLKFDASGRVIDKRIPETMQKFLSINIPAPGTSTSDVEIILKAEPYFTIGVDAVNKSDKTKLMGGKYVIRPAGSAITTPNVITQTLNTAHANMGELPTDGVVRVLQYEIIESDAPLGYQFINHNNVIGVLSVVTDGQGRIMQPSKDNLLVTNGYDYISIKETPDKAQVLDFDIEIAYEPIKELQIVIVDENILNTTTKIQADFSATLTTGQSANMTTDATTGLGILNLGPVTSTNGTKQLTINQSNVQGNYETIRPIRLNLTFDEDGKLQTLTPNSASNYAQPNVSYTVDSWNEYVITITVKNNPKTTLKIRNVADGNNSLLINSTHTLETAGLPAVTMTTVNGEAVTELTQVPKNTTVTYTLTQTSVDVGYRLNKPIQLRVHYNAAGIIDSTPYLSGGSSYADASVVNISYTDYEVLLEIKNKAIFEVYFEAEDKFDSNIKLSGIRANVRETTYSNLNVNLVTDNDGKANDELGTSFANRVLQYYVRLENDNTDYTREQRRVTYTVNVPFDVNGNIISGSITCSPNDGLISVTNPSGLAIVIKAQYTPELKMNITRNNTSTGVPLSGKSITVSSATMFSSSITRTTDTSGRINIPEAGKITENQAVYTISENITSGYTTIDALPTLNVVVTYGQGGIIADVSATPAGYATFSGIGTRTLDITIGTKQKATIAIVDLDKYVLTQRLSGASFEITSSKGETMTINGSGTIAPGSNYTIEKLGDIYPGETITYTIHQVNAPLGFEILEDIIIEVTYNSDGTIGTVTPIPNPNDNVNMINSTNTPTRLVPNIVLELMSTPQLDIQFVVEDNIYGTPVEGYEFKVKDTKSGKETVASSLTDANGKVRIAPSIAYRNETVVYEVTEIGRIGGYMHIPDFKIEVEYGPLGTIVEANTFVVGNVATLTPNYSSDLYASSKMRGIEVNIKAETQFGIGIEKKDHNGNIITGVDFTIVGINNSTGEVLGGSTVATDLYGERTEYMGANPVNATVRYTITEENPPTGFRNNIPTIIDVDYDAAGRIQSYNIVQKSNNVTLDVASSDLCKMTNSKELVGIKLNVINDNRITFKIVNKQSGINMPIKDAEFALSLETSAGVIWNSPSTLTNSDGEIIIVNVSAEGNIKFTFNQIGLPQGYTTNVANSGFITINKPSNVYDLTLVNITDDIEYELDSENGIVTIYLENDNDVQMNIIDVDADTMVGAPGATHIIKAQYGDTTDSWEAIIARTNNVITINDGLAIASDATGKTKVSLGSSKELLSKKVVYTIETPTPATSYNPIGKVYVEVEYDSLGRVVTVNGKSARLLSATNPNDKEIDVVIGYGNLDFYKIKLAKEKTNANVRINGAEFKINYEIDNSSVENWTGQVTSDKVVGGVTVEKGIIETPKLQYEGHAVIELEETKVPDGYKAAVSGILRVEFDVALDRTDPDNITLDVTQINSKHVDVSVNEFTREIVLTVKNKPFINLKINKQDEYGDSLGGMEFDAMLIPKDTGAGIDLGRLTTDNAGIITKEIENKYCEESILIRLDEVKDYNYRQIDPIIIEAYINADGEIKADTIKFNSGNANASFVAVTESSIEIKVVNELEDYVRPYSIEITKVSEEDHTNVLEGVTFQVIVTPEVGPIKYIAATTDASGKIQIPGLVGNGKVKVELYEVEAPLGYKLGVNEGYTCYEFNKDGDKMTKLTQTVEDATLWETDESTKTVKIMVENQLDKVEIAIEKIDGLNSEIKIPGVKFKLTNNAGYEKEEVTNANGIAKFYIEKQLLATSVTYTLEETEGVRGYEVDQTPKQIIIQFNADGTIANSMEDAPLNLVTRKKDYIKYQLPNEQQYIGLDTYKIEILNVDKDDGTILIPGAKFSASITQDVGAPNLSIGNQVTNSNGLITIPNVNGAGKIVIDIENELPGIGYQKITADTYVELERDRNTGEIRIQYAHNVGAKFFPETNTIQIIVESEKERNKFALKLSVFDVDSNEYILDGDARYEITINGSRTERQLDANGEIRLNGLNIDDVSEFTITVKELVAPSGYPIVNAVQEITIKVGDMYDYRILTDGRISAGNNMQKVLITSTGVEVRFLHGDITELYLKSAKDDDNKVIYDVFQKEDIPYVGSTNPKLKSYTINEPFIDTKTMIEKMTKEYRGITVDEFIANLDTNADEIKVYDPDGTEISGNTVVKTGGSIKATKGTQELNYKIVVKGDPTGDGTLRTNDSVIIKNMVMGKGNYTDLQKRAADVNSDGSLRTNDSALIKNQLSK